MIQLVAPLAGQSTSAPPSRRGSGARLVDLDRVFEPAHEIDALSPRMATRLRAWNVGRTCCRA